MIGEHRGFAAIVVDANSGRTLYARNENELRHPASVTKVMTLYLLFEQLEALAIKEAKNVFVLPHFGRLVLANRKGIGPTANCPECLYEEFFLESWANGDPALLALETPFDLTSADGARLTFASQLAPGGLAEVQVSENDTPLHRLETVYRRATEGLRTAEWDTGAFRAIISQW